MKRANGEGSIRRRPNGTFQARYTGSDGLPRSITRSTRAEAVAALREALAYTAFRPLVATEPADPCSLYRYFDAAGLLLYVGITRRMSARLLQHARQAEWWPRVSDSTIEHFPDSRSAAAAEAEAIRRELPIFNVIGRSALPLQSAESTLLELREAAAVLALGRSSVYSLVRSGRLRAVRPAGGELRIRRSDLDDFVAALEPVAPGFAAARRSA